jgi:hypothetical protein
MALNLGRYEDEIVAHRFPALLGQRIGIHEPYT